MAIMLPVVESSSEILYGILWKNLIKIKGRINKRRILSGRVCEKNREKNNILIRRISKLVAVEGPVISDTKENVS